MWNRPVREIFGWNDHKMIVLGCLVVSFLLPIFFFKADLSAGFGAYLPIWGITLYYTVSYWMTVRYIMGFYRIRFPQFNQTKRRLLFTFLTIVPVFFLLNVVLDWITNTYFPHPEHHTVSEKDYAAVSFVMILLVSSIYEGKFFFFRWKQATLEAERLRREHLQSQLEGLKSQVNPHFLFNSLNTLAYLIPEAPEKAIRFVEKLSRVYRYILEIRNEELVPLRRELDFLQAYLFLVRERFGDNIRIDINVDPAAYDRQLVPLSLQMLLENAIKHNVISSRQPLHIEILTPDLQHLTVRNNLQPKPQAQPSTGLGLANIRSRYAFFTHEPPVVEKTADTFSVQLPLLAGIGQLVQ